MVAPASRQQLPAMLARQHAREQITRSCYIAYNSSCVLWNVHMYNGKKSYDIFRPHPLILRRRKSTLWESKKKSKIKPSVEFM